MNKRDYLAFVIISLLFIIIFGAQFGLFSSNIKQEGIQEQLKGIADLILTKVNQTAFMVYIDTQREKENEFEIELARNQSITESKGRDNHTQMQVNATFEGVEILIDTVNNLFKKYNNTTEKMLQNQERVIQEILDTQKEHKTVSKDHDIIQIEVNNNTKENKDMLKLYGDNSIKKFNELINMINNTNNKNNTYLEDED